MPVRSGAVRSDRAPSSLRTAGGPDLGGALGLEQLFAQVPESLGGLRVDGVGYDVCQADQVGTLGVGIGGVVER
jgi:hypothetical protein